MIQPPHAVTFVAFTISAGGIAVALIAQIREHAKLGRHDRHTVRPARNSLGAAMNATTHEAHVRSTCPRWLSSLCRGGAECGCSQVPAQGTREPAAGAQATDRDRAPAAFTTNERR